jgi:hypothetical protein
VKDDLADVELNGGDLKFVCVEAPQFSYVNCGDINFVTPRYGEVIRIKDNGDIFVKGNFVTNDMEVVDALREFVGLSKK